MFSRETLLSITAGFVLFLSQTCKGSIVRVRMDNRTKAYRQAKLQIYGMNVN